MLSLYSLQRRRERYMIMYVWRILESLTPNFNDSKGGISAYWNARRGRMCDVPAVRGQAAAAFRQIRYSSFGIVGPRLFNMLPKELRNITDCPLDLFKRKLDEFLKTVPDEPLVSGYTSFRRADSNSLIHMVQFSNALPVRPGIPVSSSLVGLKSWFSSMIATMYFLMIFSKSLIR